MGTKYASKHQNTALAFVVSVVLSVVALFTPGVVRAQAQACAALPDTYGKITLPKDGSPVSITQQTEYNVWIRMRVKDVAHKVQVSVDGADTSGCGVELGVPSGTEIDTWVWSKTKAAGGDYKVTVPANSNLKVQIAGISSSPNVDIDKIILASDNCNPNETPYGTNCTDAVTPTPTPTATPTPDPSVAIYDLDGNREIGVGDLTLLIKDYPRPLVPTITGSPADFNNSGAVDISDLGKLVGKWGQSY
jgi:hypothetical protein